MLYNLVVDGVDTKVTINEESLRFESNGDVHISYRFDDVIGCEEEITGWFWRTEVTRVWLIEHGSSNALLKKHRIVSGDQRKSFQHDISEKIVQKTKRPKRVLLMINPNGGDRTARKDFTDIVEPVFRLSGMSMDIIFSEYPGHLIDVTKYYDFTKTDGIVLLGGDGTYHEVLNVLMKKKQEEQGVDFNVPNSAFYPLNIPFGLIPTGSACHWSRSCTGSRDVLTTALHVVKGRTVTSPIMVLYNNGKLVGFGCAGVGYGFLPNVVFRCENFRWLGRSRYTILASWVLLFETLARYHYNAKLTFQTSVTERRNPETNETEIFVADRKLTGYTSYTSDTVVFNRKFWDMLFFTGHGIYDGKALVDPSRMFVPKPSMFSCFVLFDTITPRSVRQYWKHLFGATYMDELSSVMDVLHARELSVELSENLDDADQDLSMTKRIILLDGEILELETPSFQIGYKLDIVHVFSSYL
ncbi:uncharacterized protein LOC125678315 isoform X1 [Ostrea edulis]|uniref:uncharacterized protein LOC125678315 isoform X1 n=1 Tax=Ostrea edulis TaxID=37623 RepID=UPI0020942872|nr:uncharacterized protein LOC125678315 isoform X1 [Ostrea edulis]